MLEVEVPMELCRVASGVSPYALSLLTVKFQQMLPLENLSCLLHSDGGSAFFPSNVYFVVPNFGYCFLEFSVSR